MAGEASQDLEGRSALRRASWRLLPLLWVSFIVAYMDRVNISFASVQMNHDLKFSATIYGLGAGMFFLSYALFEVPSNILLVRFGAKRWIARIMLTWGLIAMAMMFVRTPLQFYLMRFLLGVAEAGFFPGVIYYLSQWFPASHRARAISGFYTALPLSTALMGGVAGALLSLQGRFGLQGWQWMFLLEGFPALVVSLLVFLWLPDSPAKAHWLSDGERQWISLTLERENAGRLNETAHSVLGALKNPLALTLGFFFFLVIGANTAFVFSAPILLGQATGLGSAHVGYLISLANLLAAVAMMINTGHSDRTGERHLHLVIPILAVAAASFVWVAFPSPAVTIAAYFAAMMAYYAMITLIWPIASVRLHPAETAVGFAVMNSMGQLGAFVAPFLWGWARDTTGSYQTGLMVLPIPYVIGAVIILQLRRKRRAEALLSANGAEA